MGILYEPMFPVKKSNDPNTQKRVEKQLESQIAVLDNEYKLKDLEREQMLFKYNKLSLEVIKMSADLGALKNKLRNLKCKKPVSPFSHADDMDYD